jgi:hypothetical protein
MVRLFSGGVYHEEGRQGDFVRVRVAAARAAAHALRRPSVAPMARSAGFTAVATAGLCSTRISPSGAPGPTPRRSGC